MLNQNHFISLSKQICKVLAEAFFIILLMACTAEQNYRGIPNSHWQELTGEQKQLVIDQAYEQEFGSLTKTKESRNTK